MKSQIIGTRVSLELEAKFLDYAQKRKWSKSFALNEILEKFFKNYELTRDCG